MAPIQVQASPPAPVPASSNQDSASDASLPSAVAAPLPPTITVRQFRNEDLSQVRVLFRGGLMSYTHERDPLYKVWLDYIATSLKKDLADILDHYVARGGNFWVATASTDDSKKDKSEEDLIVGTFAIQKHSDDVGELRRVSVHEDYRRFGIGRQLFSHAQKWAKHEQNFKKLELSCSIKQVQAHKFYEAHGFRYTRTSAMCQDPLFENVHFEKWL